LYATLSLNCALHYSNYVRARSKSGKGNDLDLYFQVTGDMRLTLN